MTKKDEILAKLEEIKELVINLEEGDINYKVDRGVTGIMDDEGFQKYRCNNTLTMRIEVNGGARIIDEFREESI